MPSGFALTSTLITVIWSPPPAEHINGIIVNYLVEVTEVVTNNSWVFHAAAQMRINVGPFHPYYTYRCRVSASTIGPGPYTAFFYVNSGEAGMYVRMYATEVSLCSVPFILMGMFIILHGKQSKMYTLLYMQSKQKCQVGG